MDTCLGILAGGLEARCFLASSNGVSGQIEAATLSWLPYFECLFPLIMHEKRLHEPAAVPCAVILAVGWHVRNGLQ